MLRHSDEDGAEAFRIGPGTWRGLIRAVLDALRPRA